MKMVDLGPSIWCENVTFGAHILRLRMADLGPYLGVEMHHLSVKNGRFGTINLVRNATFDDHILRLRMAHLGPSI